MTIYKYIYIYIYIYIKRTHRFSVTLNFAPKRSSESESLVVRVLTDERLGAKLRVTENRCVLSNSLPSVYLFIYLLCILTSLSSSSPLAWLG